MKKQTYYKLRTMLLVLIVAVLAIASQPATRAQEIPVDGPMVVRLYVEDREHLNAVAGELDIWESHPEERYVVAAVCPEQAEWLIQLGYKLEVDEELTESLSILAPLDYRFYYFDEQTPNPNNRYVVNFLQGINSSYPDLTELLNIGTAWQGTRDMLVLRITNEDPAFGPIEEKPAFFLIATVHAREVATPELAIRYILYLTEGYDGLGGYGVDPDVTWLVDHNVAYVLVMHNPDGHAVNALDTSANRRKNMNDDECPGGNFGIDLNRNSSFMWGCCGGSSGNPCYNTYRGTSRGSEPETGAFQDFFSEVMLDQNGPNGDYEIPPAAPDDATGIFITLHSYSDLTLWPWGFSGYGLAPNHYQMQTIGHKLAFYTGYDEFSIWYDTDGTTDDWTYGKFGIPSFTFEVGPAYGACGGFFPDYECIDGIDGRPRNFWAENRPAFVYAHKIARTPYMTSYGPDTLDVAVSPDTADPGMPIELTATVTDQRLPIDTPRPIHAAEYFIGEPGEDGTGIPMAPADGEWGGYSEDVIATIDTSELPIGLHYVLIHGQNDLGDWGPFTAVFLLVEQGEYGVEVSVVGEGEVAVEPDEAIYYYGDVITLTATADIGWFFDSWSGDVEGDDEVVTHTVVGETNVTATFTLEDYTFEGHTVGEGEVTVDPEEEFYTYGDVITLTATAHPGWLFESWRGDVGGDDEVITHTIEGDTVVTATFQAIAYELDVTVVGEGEVEVEPDQDSYIYGDVITLTAIADTGWALEGWSGDVGGDDEVITHTIVGDTVVTATFQVIPYELDVIMIGIGRVEVVPDEEAYYYGDVITLTATPDTHWAFDGWGGDVEGVNEVITHTIVGDTTVIATFTREEYPIYLPLVRNQGRSTPGN